MPKNSLTAFMQDSEALKSLIILCAIIYMTITGTVSPEIGMAAMMGQGGIYGGLRVLKNTDRQPPGTAKNSNVKEQILEAIDEMKNGKGD